MVNHLNKNLDDDKHDDDDDEDEFVYLILMKNKIFLFLIIHLLYILIHLMIDEYLNQFVRINRLELYEEWNILVLDQCHI